MGEEDLADLLAHTHEAPQEAPAASAPAAASSASFLPDVSTDTPASERVEDDFDPEILEIFLEEADELMEELDESIHAWESDWDSSEAPM